MFLHGASLHPYVDYHLAALQHVIMFLGTVGILGSALVAVFRLAEFCRRLMPCVMDAYW